ncbi:hypothetical protein N657DRAFT_649101 [Parathielavia appendiculata]|uniref:Uncharacterized protein n=1 Tax=Parathielavia appendiculata TaxID=2587402 RepID=A0AAN6TTA3_9PEZI|nr:hypothetical protein N657DRAFT_649101 [Parathielavia appendiculata]
MVKFSSIAVALAATITGAQAAFKRPCVSPYDVCGWTLLNSDFGYDPASLQEATSAAGQDPTNGTIVYDSIYNCREGGVIVWNHHCDKGCDGAIWVPNANCRA